MGLESNGKASPTASGTSATATSSGSRQWTDWPDLWSTSNRSSTRSSPQGAAVHVIKENQTYTSEANESLIRLLLQVLGAFAEFERNLIRERQAEGIRIAKAAGKYRGRARALNDEQTATALQSE